MLIESRKIKICICISHIMLYPMHSKITDTVYIFIQKRKLLIHYNKIIQVG